MLIHSKYPERLKVSLRFSQAKGLIESSATTKESHV